MKLILLAVGILGRVIPHPFNATPVGAIALAGGAKLGRFWCWVIPFAALLLGDLFLNSSLYGFEDWLVIAPFVYGSFAVNILLGQRLTGSNHPGKLLGFSLVGAAQFFLITNFGTWLVGGLYPHTWAGLVECYTLAIPFFQRTLLGDLLWCAALFYGLEAVRWTSRALVPSSSHKSA